ncbi:MAG: hypothetical protein ACK5RL_17135 [Acidimicrobiales bacterium]
MTVAQRSAKMVGLYHRTGDGAESGPFVSRIALTNHDVSINHGVSSEPSRFVPPTPSGPYAMEIVIEIPEPGRITYSWWAEAGVTPVEQSKADVHLSPR